MKEVEIANRRDTGECQRHQNSLASSLADLCEYYVDALQDRGVDGRLNWRVDRGFPRHRASSAAPESSRRTHHRACGPRRGQSGASQRPARPAALVLAGLRGQRLVMMGARGARGRGGGLRHLGRGGRDDGLRCVRGSAARTAGTPRFDLGERTSRCAHTHTHTSFMTIIQADLHSNIRTDLGRAR